MRSLAILILVLSCGCSGHRDEEPSWQQAERLLHDLQTEDYRSFDRAPGWETPRSLATRPHHGAFIDIYLNDVLEQAVASSDGPPWPPGSIVIKDGWESEEGTDLHQIALMQKRDDGWFWAEYGASGTAFESGRHVAECLECHEAQGDYILSF